MNKCLTVLAFVLIVLFTSSCQIKDDGISKDSNIKSNMSLSVSSKSYESHESSQLITSNNSIEISSYLVSQNDSFKNPENSSRSISSKSSSSKSTDKIVTSAVQTISPKKKWAEIVTGDVSNNNIFMMPNVTRKNGWIYYLSTWENAIFRIKPDGTDKTKLVSGNIGMVDFKNDGYIFYWIDQKTFRVNDDGSDKIETDYIWRTDYAIINNDKVYTKVYCCATEYLDQYQLYVNGNLIYNYTTTQINFYNNDLIFCSLNSIYKMVNDSDVSLLKSVSTGQMNVSKDGTIYFNDINDEMSLYKMNIDGSNIVKLSNKKAFGICVIGNYVFFQNYEGFYKIKSDGTHFEKI